MTNGWEPITVRVDDDSLGDLLREVLERFRYNRYLVREWPEEGTDEIDRRYSRLIEDLEWIIESQFTVPSERDVDG